MSAKPTERESATRYVVGAGVLLVVLAGASYGASFLSLGRWAIGVALGIAVVKASIVVGVFMEAARRSASFLLALGAAVVLLLTLIALVAADVAFRGPSPVLPAPHASTARTESITRRSGIASRT